MLGGKVLGLAVFRLCVAAISRQYLGSCSAGRCSTWRGTARATGWPWLARGSPRPRPDT